jgi:hypothetical protein
MAAALNVIQAVKTQAAFINKGFSCDGFHAKMRLFLFVYN